MRRESSLMNLAQVSASAEMNVDKGSNFLGAPKRANLHTLAVKDLKLRQLRQLKVGTQNVFLNILKIKYDFGAVG